MLFSYLKILIINKEVTFLFESDFFATLGDCPNFLNKILSKLYCKQLRSNNSLN